MARLNALIAACVLLIAGYAPGVAASRPAPVASIRGNVWTANNTAVAHARLRLRNVETGKLAATTQANEAGLFTFGIVEPGAYLVEVVDHTGSVLAVGHRFSIGAGETVDTFVRLPASHSWFSGFFGNAAAAVATSAASQGITALAPVGRPASAGR